MSNLLQNQIHFGEIRWATFSIFSELCPIGNAFGLLNLQLTAQRCHRWACLVTKVKNRHAQWKGARVLASNVTRAMQHITKLNQRKNMQVRFFRDHPFTDRNLFWVTFIHSYYEIWKSEVKKINSLPYSSMNSQFQNFLFTNNLFLILICSHRNRQSKKKRSFHKFVNLWNFSGLR